MRLTKKMAEMAVSNYFSEEQRAPDYGLPFDLVYFYKRNGRDCGTLVCYSAKNGYLKTFIPECSITILECGKGIVAYAIPGHAKSYVWQPEKRAVTRQQVPKQDVDLDCGS